MKRKCLAVLLSCAMLFAYAGCGQQNMDTSSSVAKGKYFDFHKRDFVVVEEADTHGGFHGDGTYYIILDCSDDQEQALSIVADWETLPLSENLELMLYGGTREGVIYGYDLAETAKIPKIENGYYYFYDRHSESTDSRDDSELFERSSFNFSLALYDVDTSTLYYVEFDT